MKLSVSEEVTLKFLLEDVLANMEYDECLEAYVLQSKEDIVLDKDDFEQMKSLKDRL